jgi:Ca2+/Na+ antiporter
MKKIISEFIYDAEFIRGHTLQPQWYKILKVFLVFGFIGAYYALFGGRKTLLFGVIFFGLCLLVHMVYRSKTERYTRSWLDFVVMEDEQGQRSYRRIGIFYYLAVIINLIVAIFLSQVVQ